MIYTMYNWATESAARMLAKLEGPISPCAWRTSLHDASHSVRIVGDYAAT